VELGDGISREVNDRVVALGRALAGLPGLVAVVPTYRSLFVQYDPWEISYESLRTEVELRLARSRAGGHGRRTGAVRELPVCYHPRVAPDLEKVARLHGLSPGEVADVHAAPAYRVYMLGFTPGFLFLGGLDRRLHTPRLPEPRARVPAGSVGIAGAQTGAYAIASPGGWRLIGRTPLRLFDPGRTPPSAAEPGDTVRFVPISLDEYRRLDGEVP
jgi:KipI family sensor histidine kinase inhibitor